VNGADDQNRTGDLVLTKDALCQLSYIGLDVLAICGRHVDLDVLAICGRHVGREFVFMSSGHIVAGPPSR
jgi:hypothetical protein